MKTEEEIERYVLVKKKNKEIEKDKSRNTLVITLLILAGIGFTKTFYSISNLFLKLNITNIKLINYLISGSLGILTMLSLIVLIYLFVDILSSKYKKELLKR